MRKLKCATTSTAFHIGMHALSLLLLGATASTAQRVVSWDIQRLAVPPASAAKKVRRATITESLGNEQNLYYANVTVGSNNQLLQLQLDTG